MSARNIAVNAIIYFLFALGHLAWDRAEKREQVSGWTMLMLGAGIGCAGLAVAA